MMTKSEIIEYIQENHYKRITHYLFAEEEYLYMADDGCVYDEDGYLFEDWFSGAHCGIRVRTGDHWENGWSVCL